MTGTQDLAPEISALLEAARSALQESRSDVADALFARVLEVDPDNTEALHQRGLHALVVNAPFEAVHWLSKAAALDRGNPHLLKNLGVAYVNAERLDEARFALEKALQLKPDFFIARLHLGSVMGNLNYPHAALAHYFAAVTQAQATGRWLNDKTTVPGLRALVVHAMAQIDNGRQALFAGSLDGLRAVHGDAALERVMRCLDIYLGLEPAAEADPRQRPKFLYFPDLPTTPFFARELFPWYAQLESHTAVIRAELDEVLRSDEGLEPFLKFNSPQEGAHFLAGGETAPVWDAFFFYRHGERVDANCARCPRTAALIDALPLVRIREHAPEICFSVLTAGTHILPHRGVTNTRLVTHLPLIVPENCALTVGGEMRHWREGECFTFDDTYEHEAWNRGNSTRVILLMDCWNPYLTEVEREAVTLLVAAIGDFNREAGVTES